MAGLRDRLNAISRTGNSPKVSKRETGLLRYTSASPMPPSLYAPASDALRRIGWSGRTFDPEQCLFLDTETTGLSGGAGTVAFLVGMGMIKNGVMEVEQWFMRDYPDEHDLLDRVEARLRACGCVVTFNGRTFDLPLLKARAAMDRRRDWPEPEQLDLLFPSRRVWKLRLENCRLGTLEEALLGIRREGDLPGSEVPARYFDYLKSGDIDLVRDIIDHNRQDIVTLGLLLDRLLRVWHAPEEQTEIRDLFSLGKALESQGEPAPARRLYRLSAVPRPARGITALKEKGIAGQANLRLYRLLMREGDWDGAEETLLQMLRRGQMGILPHIELSKLYEYRKKDLAAAERHAEEALNRCPEEERPQIERRLERILRKKKLAQETGERKKE